MNRIKNNENKKIKYLNEFPLIIIIAIVAIALILIMMYLKIKPYGTIYKDGYMILSDNMTNNLINNNATSEAKKFDVGVTAVANGDYIYKSMDSYYVGVEQKLEVEYDYPIYSKDGLTIYNLNKNVLLVDRNFEENEGYPGFSLNYGVLYNDGDEEPADDVDYLFIDLKNSIYISAQIITIKTIVNEYVIPVHSPIYFDSNKINYYAFDGKKFQYNTIKDISYESIIKIGDVTLNYGAFLLNMELFESQNSGVDENEKEEEKEDFSQIENEQNDSSDKKFIKPEVNVTDFVSTVYSASASITIKDLGNVITTKPTFEIYTMDDELFLRKKVTSTGEVVLSGLSANTQYKIIGVYKYKNEKGLSIVNNFYEGTITTKSIDSLDEIELGYTIGNIYPDRIELRDFLILNKDIEAVSGIKRVVLSVRTKNKKEYSEYNLTYSEIKKIVKGEKIIFSTPKVLNSDSIYEYKINIYDKDNNELNCVGTVEGKTTTSMKDPSIKATVDNDRIENIVTINLEMQNEDSVNIKDLKYFLCTYSGKLVSEGVLDDENGSTANLEFKDMEYNTNYILQIRGLYDTKDGKGERELKIDKDFTTVDLSSKFSAWYNKESLDVKHDSIKAEVFVSKSTTVLEKNNVEVIISLTDKEGNEILDENGKLKHFVKYASGTYNNSEYNDYYFNPTFENLLTEVEYNIKVEILVKQLDEEKKISKILTPTIKTKDADATVYLNSVNLIGDNLELNLTVDDPGPYISEDGILIEIYEGEYNKLGDINGKSPIFRGRYKLEEDGNFLFGKSDYTGDAYTIFVAANPYKNVRNKSYLKIESNSDDNLYAIIAKKGLTSYVEMYEQIRIDKQDKYIYDTNFRFKYNSDVQNSNLIFVDCIRNSCSNLGYINSAGELNKINDRLNDIYEIDGDFQNRKMLSIRNGNDTENHTIYVVTNKINVIPNIKNFTLDRLKTDFYILDELVYNTSFEIYNINHASQFFDTTFMKNSNETKRYVVTENLDFGVVNENGEIKDYRFTKTNFNNFNGEIDFQGYYVNLHCDEDHIFYLFNSTGENGKLKNAVLNYNLDYKGVMSKETPGFVNTNNGKLENIIVNVEQTRDSGYGRQMGLLAYQNNGEINSFAVILKSNIKLHATSAIVSYKNNGTINNGYITTDPNKNTSYRIELSNLLYNLYGSFVNKNNGTVKNVYNLIDVKNIDATSSYYGGGAIVAINNSTGVVSNTISVANIVRGTGTNFERGPNVYDNRGGLVQNNFYVDTNKNGVTYNNNLNTRIISASLVNSSTWNVILNQDHAFVVVPEYYPILKMNKFMIDKQSYQLIPFDYMNDSKVDILSSEVLEDNDGVRNTGLVKIHISNPDKYLIDSIEIDGLKEEIIEETYEENSQSSVITLRVSLEDGVAAKSSYYISGFKYKLNVTEPPVTVSYEETPRIIYIDMYRAIKNPMDLKNCLDSNENCYLSNDISFEEYAKHDRTISDSEKIVNKLLPDKNKHYTAIFDGCNKTIDFAGMGFGYGFYIRYFDGTLQNIKIKNYAMFAYNTVGGFIGQSSNANLINVDVSDVYMVYTPNTKQVGYQLSYGTLVGVMTNSYLDSVSVNNLMLLDPLNAQGNYKDVIASARFGGIVGSAEGSSITNSYVYNFQTMNIDWNGFDQCRTSSCLKDPNKATLTPGIKKDNLNVTYTIGGLIGYLKTTQVTNCYTTGKIDIEYPNVGGIVGSFVDNASLIENNYSYMEIHTTEDNVGGIVGVLFPNYYTVIKNNMFIGYINNKNSKEKVSLIAPYGFVTNSNYTLIPEAGTKIIEPLSGLNSFDINSAFSVIKEYNNVYLPYLVKSSPVTQQIAKQKFVNLNNKSYEIEYTYSDECIQKISEIKDVNGKIQGTLNSDLYTDACAISATLKFNDNNYSLNYEFDENGDAVTEDLKIKRNNDNGIISYTIEPINHYNYYVMNVKIGGEYVEDFNVDLRFYRPIYGIDDWNKIVDSENIILMDNIIIDESINITPNKNILNFLGNGKKFGASEDSEDIVSIPNNLIETISKTMRDVSFDKLSIIGETTNTSLIKFNHGLVENCEFSNITISSSEPKTAIISSSSGDIKNIKLKNIQVNSEKNYVAALMSYDATPISLQIRVDTVYAENIKVSGVNYVGGIIGYVEYKTQNLHLKGSDNEIKGASYIGGVIARGNCDSCSLENAVIETSGSNVGGIGGFQITNAYLNNLSVKNLTIRDVGDPSVADRSNVGGVYSNAWYFSKVSIDNLKILANDRYNENGELIEYSNFGASNVGGISNRSGGITYGTIQNSIVTGKNNVGGYFGISLSASAPTRYNLILNTEIKGYNNVGGIFAIANSFRETSETFIQDNIISKTKLSSDTGNAGGLFGTLDNRVTAMQNFYINRNLLTDVSIDTGGYSSTGGFIGSLSQIPATPVKVFENNIFYGKITAAGVGITQSYDVPLIGKIGYQQEVAGGEESKLLGLDTGLGSENGGYDNIKKDEDIGTFLENFYSVNNFKEYLPQENIKTNYQINSYDDLKHTVSNLYKNYKLVEMGEDKYFPIFTDNLVKNYSHLLVPNEDYVKIPYDSKNPILGQENVMVASLFANRSVSYKNPIEINYDVYSSGVDKINIEFDNQSSNTYFYYKIGDFTSKYIPINNRTYTLTYDYKTPINFYVTNGFNYKETTIKPKDVAKTISSVDGVTYYINSRTLYNESKMILGSFVNLFGDEVLTLEGKIYNLKSKQERETIIDYSILPNSIPIYEFSYDGNTIKTYYKYSIINGVEKEYQLLVKNGNLNYINPNLNNKKNMYLIDYYNNNEIQIVLKNDGKLYSIKHNISYPGDILNKDISEIYTNINSLQNIVILKYTNGAVYTFDYRTGKVLFTNVSNENISFIDFVKDKLSGNASYNVIENVSSKEKYKEIDLLKNKLTKMSLEEVLDKIYNQNNYIPKTEDYITVYNELTDEYEIYKTSVLLDADPNLESETQKMIRNYDLVEFYETSGKGKNKNSINGIIIFGISIVSVLIALTLLIKHKLNKKGGVI